MDAKRIREWCQKKAEFENATNPRKRLHGGGRKPLSTALEERVLEWIHDMRAQGQAFPGRQLARKERSLGMSLSHRTRLMPPAGSDNNEEISQEDFKASNGWVVRFMNRHGLTLCKRTSLAQHDPGNLIDRVISFILNVRRKFHEKEYAKEHVIAMDETPICLICQALLL